MKDGTLQPVSELFLGPGEEKQIYVGYIPQESHYRLHGKLQKVRHSALVSLPLCCFASVMPILFHH